MKGMKVALTIVVSLVLVGLAGAYPPGWKGPKTITKFGISDPPHGWDHAKDASIAVNGNAIYMVYYTSQGGTPYNWWFKKSVNNGLTWSDSLLIWDKQANGVYRISAITVSDGVIHVLMSGLGNSSGDQAGIFYRRSSDGGNSWWPVLSSPPLDIADGTNYTGTIEHHPSIACLGNNVVAVWRGRDVQSQGPWVFSNYSPDGGLTWALSPGKINSQGDWYDYPNVLIKPGVTNYTFCFYSGAHTSNSGVLYSVSSDFGIHWGNQRWIRAPVVATQVPSAALLPTGNVFVAWDGNDISPPNYRICYQLVNESGLVGIMGLVAPSSDPFHQRTPRVAVGPLDNVTVVWEDNRPDQSRYRIFARSGGGDPIQWEANYDYISEEANQPPNIYDDLNPDIAFLSCSNSRVVVWDGLYNYPTDQSRQIWYHKKSTDNLPPSPPEGLQVWELPGLCLYLQWVPPDEAASGYNVYRGANFQPCQKITPQPTAETYYVDCDVNLSWCYEYYVTSLDCAENEGSGSNHAFYWGWGCFGDGFQMAYVDAGTPASSRNTQRRAGYLDWGGVPEKTVDYDPDRLTYRFEGLNPDSTYLLKLGGYEEPGSRGRRFSVEFDGVRVLSKGGLPGTPAKTAYLVPKAAYRDGAVDVSFIRERGPNVVVAELWLLRVHPKKGGPQSGEGVDLQGAVAKLYPARPNPTTGVVRFEYALATANRVNFAVYDVSGRLVRKLVDSEQSAGSHHLTWDGKDGAGKKVSTGTYFYQLQVGSAFQTRNVLVVR